MTFMTDETMADKELEDHVITTIDAPVFFNVDETLVLHRWPKELNNKEMIIMMPGETSFAYAVVPHQPHIDQLIKHYERGCKIYVWSQGGEDWAEEVIDALGLKKYVTACMTKPVWIYDDIPMANWLPDTYRVYMDPVDGHHTKQHTEIGDDEFKKISLIRKLHRELLQARAKIAELQEEK